jgi:hypothetical protein
MNLPLRKHCDLIVDHGLHWAVLLQEQLPLEKFFVAVGAAGIEEISDTLANAFW